MRRVNIRRDGRIAHRMVGLFGDRHSVGATFWRRGAVSLQADGHFLQVVFGDWWRADPKRDSEGRIKFNYGRAHEVATAMARAQFPDAIDVVSCRPMAVGDYIYCPVMVGVPIEIPFKPGIDRML